jgi:transcription elongation factor Elf1
LSIAMTCPMCNAPQEVFLDPFIVKDYSHISTAVYSVDRVTLHCQNCGQSLMVEVKRQTDSNSGESPNKTDVTKG